MALTAVHLAALDTMPLTYLKASLASHKASLPKLLAMGARRVAADTAILIDAMDKALAKRPAPVKARVGTSASGHTAALYD